MCVHPPVIEHAKDLSECAGCLGRRMLRIQSFVSRAVGFRV